MIYLSEPRLSCLYILHPLRIMSHISRSLDPHDTSIRNHGLLASLAFLVIIPLGTLIARYFRTFNTKSVTESH